MSPTPVLMVTDIGHDADDTTALLYAMGLVIRSEIRLLGVVTSGGNNRSRARLVRHLLVTYGLGEIAVCAGAEPGPAWGAQTLPRVHFPGGAARYGRYADSLDPRPSAQFIAEVIGGAGDGVEVWAIGPLGPFADAISGPATGGTRGHLSWGPKDLDPTTVRWRAEPSAEAGIVSVPCPSTDTTPPFLNAVSRLVFQGQHLGGAPSVAAFNVRQNPVAAWVVFRACALRGIPLRLAGKFAAYAVPARRPHLDRIARAVDLPGEMDFVALFRDTIRVFFQNDPALFLEINCRRNQNFDPIHLARFEAGGVAAVDFDALFDGAYALTPLYDPTTLVLARTPALFSLEQHGPGHPLIEGVGQSSSRPGVLDADAVVEALIDGISALGVARSGRP